MVVVYSSEAGPAMLAGVPVEAKPASKVDSGNPEEEIRRTAKGRRLPRNAWKPGQSGNPAGRPKDGKSWAGILRELSEMSADEIAKMVGTDNELGKMFLTLPRKTQMQYLITARVMASLMFEPQPGLFNALMERMDGRVPQAVDVTSDGEKLTGIIQIIEHKNDDGQT